MEAKSGVLSLCTYQVLLLVLWFLAVGHLRSFTYGEETLGSKCVNDISNLMKCQNYATGSKDSPSDGCCSAVRSERSSNPVCLCYTIQQVGNKTSQFSNLNLQVDRLLQLPAHCGITNSSSSDCPRLLNLPPNSPDIALFNRSTSATAGSSTNRGPRSLSHQFKPNLVFSITVAVIVAVLKS